MSSILWRFLSLLLCLPTNTSYIFTKIMSSKQPTSTIVSEIFTTKVSSKQPTSTSEIFTTTMSSQQPTSTSEIFTTTMSSKQPTITITPNSAIDMTTEQLRLLSISNTNGKSAQDDTMYITSTANKQPTEKSTTAIPTTDISTSDIPGTVISSPSTNSSTSDTPGTVISSPSTTSSTSDTPGTVISSPSTTSSTSDTPTTVSSIPPTDLSTSDIPTTVTPIPSITSTTSDTLTTVNSNPTTNGSPSETPITLTSIPTTDFNTSDSPSPSHSFFQSSINFSSWNSVIPVFFVLSTDQSTSVPSSSVTSFSPHDPHFSSSTETIFPPSNHSPSTPDTATNLSSASTVSSSTFNGNTLQNSSSLTAVTAGNEDQYILIIAILAIALFIVIFAFIAFCIYTRLKRRKRNQMSSEMLYKEQTHDDSSVESNSIPSREVELSGTQSGKASECVTSTQNPSSSAALNLENDQMCNETPNNINLQTCNAHNVTHEGESPGSHSETDNVTSDQSPATCFIDNETAHNSKQSISNAAHPVSSMMRANTFVSRQASPVFDKDMTVKHSKLSKFSRKRSSKVSPYKTTIKPEWYPNSSYAFRDTPRTNPLTKGQTEYGSTGVVPLCTLPTRQRAVSVEAWRQHLEESPYTRPVDARLYCPPARLLLPPSRTEGEFANVSKSNLRSETLLNGVQGSSREHVQNSWSLKRHSTMPY